MNRLITLLLIGGGLFLLILFVNRPDLLEEIWLWLIGLSGTIIQVFKRLIDYFKEDKSKRVEKHIPDQKNTSSIDQPQSNNEIESIQKVSENKGEIPITITKPYATLPISIQEKENFFKGTTITVLRCSDDGKTTIGWLYLNGKYFCYTLEDTYREVKVKNETRIPSGTYKVSFNKYDTKKTLQYREQCAPWFTYHLHLKNVPNFQGIYIHSGGTYKHTSGCLLVSDRIVTSSDVPFFTNSKNTFERLYKILSEKLNSGEKVRIVIYDEKWTSNLKY